MMVMAFPPAAALAPYPSREIAHELHQGNALFGGRFPEKVAAEKQENQVGTPDGDGRGDHPFLPQGFPDVADDIVEQDDPDADGKSGRLAGTLVLDPERYSDQREDETGEREGKTAVILDQGVASDLVVDRVGADVLAKFPDGHVELGLYGPPCRLQKVDGEVVVLEFQQPVIRCTDAPVDAAVFQGKPERLCHGIVDDHPGIGKDGGRLLRVPFILDQDAGHQVLILAQAVHVDDQAREIVVEDPLLEIQGRPSLDDIDEEVPERGVPPGEAVDGDDRGGKVGEERAGEDRRQEPEKAHAA